MRRGTCAQVRYKCVASIRLPRRRTPAKDRQRMNPLPDFLAAHWCPALLLGVALTVLVVLGLLRRRKVRWATLLFVLSSILAVGSAGGFVLPPRWGLGVLVCAAAIFACLFLILALTGAWRPSLGYAVAVLALLGAGGLWLNAAGSGFLEICRDLRGLTFLQPWWLL